LIENIVRHFLWGGGNFSPEERHFPQYLKTGNDQYDQLQEKLSSSSVLGSREFAKDLLSDFSEFLSFPLRRYRLAARLRRLPEQQRFKVLETLEKEMRPEPNPKQNPLPSTLPRSKIISPHQDPLLILHRDLNIRRFLTTNYDHEIERLFENSGYHKSLENLSSHGQLGSRERDPIAPTFKDTVFTREWTGELAASATSDRNRRRTNWVVHLHGRAEADGEIIVTEDDYQKHYARNDKRRAFVDDAIKLAFSAQPILFVGIGMEEIDLLRPLREFISEPTRLGDRLAVALLPGEKSEREEAAQKIRLLRGYGVYTIHYGWASMEEKDQTGEEKKSDVRWLALIKAIKDKVDTVLALSSDSQKFEDAINKESLPHIKEEADTTEDNIFHNIAARRQELSKFLDDSKKKDPDLFTDTSDLKVPVTLETLPVKEFESSAAKEIQFPIAKEIEILNEALKFAQSLLSPAFRDIPSTFGMNDPSQHVVMKYRNFWFQQRREAQSHRVNLAGTYNAINTACLCAALKRVSNDWQKWREDWARLPEPPPIHGDLIEGGLFSKGYNEGKIEKGKIKVLLRHAIDLPLNPSDEANSYKRFYSGAPSQTFYAFLSALETAKDALQDSNDVRRIFLLIARRGVGKGHFFAALQPHHPRENLEESRRLVEFLTTIGPDTKWAGAAFFNLSFSLEVESIFDRLASFLWDCWAQDDPGQKARFLEDWNRLKNNRLERLDYIFRLYEQHPPPYRILAAFNGISIMFDHEGRAKNSQLQQLFEILIAHRFRGLPIDLVFVCTENAIPEYFRVPPDIPPSREAGNSHHTPELRIPLHELRRADIDEKSRRALTEHGKLLKLHIVNGDNADSTISFSGTNFVHLLHEARASVLINSFFPVVALIIARYFFREFVNGSDEGKQRLLALPKSPNQLVNFFDLVTAQETRVAVKQFLGAGLTPHTKERCLFKTNKKVFPQLMVAFAWALEKGDSSWKPAAIIKALDRSCTDDPKELANRLLTILGVLPKQQISESLEELIKKKRSDEELIDKFEKAADKIDEFTKQLYEDVGRGRFTLTLLMAAIYELFSAMVPDASSSSQTNLNSDPVDRGVTTCMRFLERIRLDLKNQGAQRREDVVLEKVLQVYKSQHESGAPVPFFPGQQDFQLFIVQQQILWHLAVISVPVTISVLAQCPLIQKALHEYLEKMSKEGKKEDADTLKTLIKLLELRCLVYRLKPRVPPDSPKEEGQERYGVHRRLQRYIFSQMSAPFVEYPEVDQFSLTLYASQPNDIPRLSPRAHADLRKTVATLSGYPEDNQAIAAFEKFPPKDRAPALRAAYGILRSIYSVAGVARFNIGHERIENELNADGSLFGLGFFEEHRQQIRWVAEQAKKLAEELEKEKTKRKVTDVSPYTPFYAGEIVWLYNECGVLSLLQGRLPDAFALFDLAVKALDDLEPNRNKPGPMRALVSLNQAIVDIERGRIRRAAQTLTVIIPVFLPADEEARLIAEGYLGLTHHLRGNFDKAEELYRQVISGLAALHKSRSSSIFHRHHGDLLRRRGKLHEAEEAVQAAIHLAQEGSHEDTHHLAILSEIRLLIQKDPVTSQPGPIHSRLDIVEHYARVMGIPRMMAEVHEHRARLHLRSGDLRTAGTFARRSLEISSLHELQIRKANGLVLYAEINLKLGFSQACRPLLEEAMTIARDTDYYLVYKRAQEIEHELKRSGDTQDFPVG
jgi:tetratricopeptide (TPR) repeat protein